MLLAVGLALRALLAGPAPETADDLVRRAIEARGGLEKLRAVESVRMSGTMRMGPGMELPVVLEMKRPRRTRMEFKLPGASGVQAFDGQQAWGIPPGAGQGPQPLPPEMSKDLESQADIDGPLVDYAAKGHRVELVGRETVDDRDAWRLAVTLRGGEVQQILLDAESYLPVRVESKRRLRDGEVTLESAIGDYRPVAGVLWPHSIVSGAKGRPERQSLSFEKIEVNPPLDDARFSMPARGPAEPRED